MVFAAIKYKEELKVTGYQKEYDHSHLRTKNNFSAFKLNYCVLLYNNNQHKNLCRLSVAEGQSLCKTRRNI